MATFSGLEPGQEFARDFRIVKPLAEGGMGAVYAAEQISTGKQRALKVMHPRLVLDAKSRERFVLEARVGARIESDHVVEVVGAGVDDATGAPWLAMELLRGETLAALMERRKVLEPPAVREVFAQLGHALAAAHREGIVHRDIKPENIFLAAPRRSGVPFTVKVLDFGIAKFVGSSQAVASTTAAVGSPLWMAPEQTGSAHVTAATDVWPVGLMAFYLLTGRSYWRAANAEALTLAALLTEICVEPLAPASQRAAALGVAQLVPEGFDPWFARCVSRDVAARFADGGAATEALGALIGLPSQSVPFAASLRPPSIATDDWKPATAVGTHSNDPRAFAATTPAPDPTPPPAPLITHASPAPSEPALPPTRAFVPPTPIAPSLPRRFLRLAAGATLAWFLVRKGATFFGGPFGPAGQRGRMSIHENGRFPPIVPASVPAWAPPYSGSAPLTRTADPDASVVPADAHGLVALRERDGGHTTSSAGGEDEHAEARHASEHDADFRAVEAAVRPIVERCWRNALRRNAEHPTELVALTLQVEPYGIAREPRLEDSADRLLKTCIQNEVVHAVLPPVSHAQRVRIPFRLEVER